jgi:adenosylcobinamide kinase/adenosylcobinamide-phosphate guanylyltransferase
MRITLLGTGGADGWPNPFCSCASCLGALERGEIRGQSAALVDGVLLLDCGPEVPRNALRQGISLRDVRHLLITHAHPDHTGAAALMWRGWVERERPLCVVGPPAVIAECRQWVGPDDPVDFREVRAGEQLRVGEYDVRVLAAAHADESVGPAVLYDVTGPDARLLYATDTAALPESSLVDGAAYDGVLMEETFGDHSSHDSDHLDLTTWPEQVRRLRAVGAVTDRTRLVVTHLGHRNPPTAELASRLQAWGAEVLPDGAVIDLGEPTTASRGRPRRTLVLGGARSGKSSYAESLLADSDDVTYVATSGRRSDDPEWAARVAAHRERRPAHWETVETTDLVGLLRSGTGPVLIDCLTLWLTSVMDRVGAWDGGDWRGEVDALVDAWRATDAVVVAVTNEVGSGVVPASASGRLFRDALGTLNARIAANSESVVEVVAGIPRPLR